MSQSQPPSITQHLIESDNDALIVPKESTNQNNRISNHRSNQRIDVAINPETESPPKSKQSAAIKVMQSLYSNIKTSLQFASNTTSRAIIDDPSFKLFIDQCISMKQIESNSFSHFVHSQLHQSQSDNHPTSIWYQLSCNLSEIIVTLNDHPFHPEITAIAKMIGFEAESFRQNCIAYSNPLLIGRNNKTEEEQSSYSDTKDDEVIKYDVSRSGFIEDLEECIICSLPLVDDQFDCKHLFRFQCCNGRSHLHCAVQLVNRRNSKWRRHCQGCHREMDELLMERIWSLRNNVTKLRSVDILENDEKNRQSALKMGGNYGQRHCKGKSEEVALFYLDDGSVDTRTVYDLYSRREETFAGRVPMWISP